MTGVGFLGAGVILRQGINVIGLNTAATLWCAAMVGTLAGGGQHNAAMVATAFVVLTNYALRPLVMRLNERVLRGDTAATYYTVEVICDGNAAAHVRQVALRALQAATLTLHEIASEDVPGTTHVRISARLRRAPQRRRSGGRSRQADARAVHPRGHLNGRATGAGAVVPQSL